MATAVYAETLGKFQRALRLNPESRNHTLRNDTWFWLLEFIGLEMKDTDEVTK